MPPEAERQVIEMLRQALADNREDHAAINRALGEVMAAQTALEIKVTPRRPPWWRALAIGSIACLMGWGAATLVKHESGQATATAERAEAARDRAELGVAIGSVQSDVTAIKTNLTQLSGRVGVRARP